MEISFDDAVDICGRFGEFYESLDDVMSHIYDEETLPMPKTIILKAMIVAYLEAPDEEYRDAIVMAATVLPNFQPDIGGEALSNGLQINAAMDILDGQDLKELSQNESSKLLETLFDKGSNTESDIEKYQKVSKIANEERLALIDHFKELGSNNPILNRKTSRSSNATESDSVTPTSQRHQETAGDTAKSIIGYIFGFIVVTLIFLMLR